MSFGDAVKRLREARGWNQEELARRSGIKQGGISNIERNRKTNPTQTTIDRLAAAFEITPLELLIAAGLTPPPAVLALRQSGVPDASLVELASIWDELTDEDRATALAVTRSLWERRKKGTQPITDKVTVEQHLAAG